MIDFFLRLDSDLFIALNGLHNSFFDAVMVNLTNRYYPIPFYVLLIVLVIWKYGRNGIWAALVVGLAVLVANHTTSEIMKPLFGRLRPCYNPDLAGTIHLLVPCGGQWSFASSHASSTFGLASALWLVFCKRISWVWVVFIWSTLVSYSRIYVGKHYPADVLVGAAIGFLSAWLIYQVYLRLGKKYSIGI
jgi:undecaprenyl-diphosphatase